MTRLPVVGFSGHLMFYRQRCFVRKHTLPTMATPAGRAGGDFHPVAWSAPRARLASHYRMRGGVYAADRAVPRPDKPRPRGKDAWSGLDLPLRWSRSEGSLIAIRGAWGGSAIGGNARCRPR